MSTLQRAKQRPSYSMYTDKRTSSNRKSRLLLNHQKAFEAPVLSSSSRQAKACFAGNLLIESTIREEIINEIIENAKLQKPNAT